MKTIERFRIRAPIQKVFDFVSKPDLQKLWMDGLVKTEFLRQWNENSAVGTKFNQHLIKGPKKSVYDIQGEILAYVAPSLYEIKLEGKEFSAKIKYELKEMDGKTQLDTISEMEFRGGFVARFLGKMAAHHNKQDMKKFIVLVEQNIKDIG
jgi:uncharacterized protein YndB with AHSA1/START domain